MTEGLLQKFAWTFRGVLPPESAQSGATTSLEIDDETDALVDAAARGFWIRTDAEMPRDTLEHYLVDLILPMLLAHDGHLVLHAGVVASAVGGIGLIGPSGVGKSTLTAGLLQDGCVLLSDDSVLLHAQGTGQDTAQSNGIVAEPIYPSLRLFPDSLNRVLPDIDVTGPVAHYFDKQRVQPAAHLPQSPLNVLFRLEEASDAARIETDRLRPNDACMALLANAFAFDPTDRAQMAQRFRHATAVARHLPVFSLRYPRQFERLPEVVAHILELARRLPSGGGCVGGGKR